MPGWRVMHVIGLSDRGVGCSIRGVVASPAAPCSKAKQVGGDLLPVRCPFPLVGEDRQKFGVACTCHNTTIMYTWLHVQCCRADRQKFGVACTCHNTMATMLPSSEGCILMMPTAPAMHQKTIRVHHVHVVTKQLRRRGIMVHPEHPVRLRLPPCLGVSQREVRATLARVLRTTYLPLCVYDHIILKTPFLANNSNLLNHGRI
jgi:hypothetical protein